jgi:hypothetical protein
MSLTKENDSPEIVRGSDLVAVIVTCVQIALFFMFGKPQLGDGYLEGQWALDYSGGFVRRGLFGTVAGALVSAGDFVAVVRPVFFLVALAALAVSTWKFARLADWSSPGRMKLDVDHLLLFGVMAGNPLFWSFYAESVGRFDQVFFLLAVYIVGLSRKSPRGARWLLLATAPILGTVHELYLLLYYPLLLGFVASSGRWERFNRRVLLLGLTVGVGTLVVLYGAPLLLDSDPVAASLAIKEKLNQPGMGHAGEAVSISQQRIVGATTAVFATGSVVTSLLELIVTTGFFCACAFVSGGPLAQSLIVGSPSRPVIRPMVLGLGCYAILCLIASDWGRIFMDTFMLLIALAPPSPAGDGSSSNGSGSELLLDVFPSRIWYLVAATLLFALSTNLPLTKIPIAELLPILTLGQI